MCTVLAGNSASRTLIAAAANAGAMVRQHQRMYVPPPVPLPPQEQVQAASVADSAAFSRPVTADEPVTGAPTEAPASKVAEPTFLAADVPHSSSVQQAPDSAAATSMDWQPSSTVHPDAAADTGVLPVLPQQQPDAVVGAAKLTEHALIPADSEAGEDGQAALYDGADSPVAGSGAGKGKGKAPYKSHKPEVSSEGFSITGQASLPNTHAWFFC